MTGYATGGHDRREVTTRKLMLYATYRSSVTYPSKRKAGFTRKHEIVFIGSSLPEIICQPARAAVAHIC